MVQLPASQPQDAPRFPENDDSTQEFNLPPWRSLLDKAVQNRRLVNDGPAMVIDPKAGLTSFTSAKSAKQYILVFLVLSLSKGSSNGLLGYIAKFFEQVCLCGLHVCEFSHLNEGSLSYTTARNTDINPHAVLLGAIRRVLARKWDLCLASV